MKYSFLIYCFPPHLPPPCWLCGKASASRAGDMRIGPRLSKPSRTSDLKIGTLATTVQGDWRYTVNAGTSRSDVGMQ